ncbi:16791_t:CDS:2, partial [Acaulospora morrowiae]
MEKSQSNIDQTRRLIILSFWVVILIGIPLWWKTTEVYRAQLPFTEIEEWSNWETLGIDFPIHFTLYVAEVEDSVNNFGNLSARLEKSIMSKYDSINSISGENSSLKSIRFPIKCEMVKWDGWKDALKERFDPEILNFESRNGQYAFYILPGSSVNTKVLVGNQRQAIIEVKNWNIEIDSMRTMKYSPMYQVTFSLMNGDPSSLLVDWDIERA